MCYSSLLKAELSAYVRLTAARLDVDAFAALFWRREQGAKIAIPRAVERWFEAPGEAAARSIADCIAAHRARRTHELEQRLFAQRQRLVAAERALATRPTQKAREDQRIAGNKIAWAREALAALRREAPVPGDARIYPGWYAPVVVEEGARRWIRPLRYQCRPAGKPASYDRRFPGTYNARRDNLEGFWKGQFGHTHALMLAEAFYENVARHDLEQRPLRDGERVENVILEFRPEGLDTLLAACLWSHWEGGGEVLDSFAAITDTPPAEIAAAGHDRCIVPLAAAAIDAWLAPQALDRATLRGLLDQRERPWYAHRIAA
jgi:putative SOS response-associated peptidase YedK